MNTKTILQNPRDVEAFSKETFDKFWEEQGDWVQAKEWAFHELNAAQSASIEVERLRHAELINLAFTVGGETGARMIDRIEPTHLNEELGDTKAFEVVYGGGETLYHRAISAGEPEMLDALVRRIRHSDASEDLTQDRGDVAPGFINKQDNHKRTALHCLAQHSSNAGLGVKMSLHERQEAARTLIVDAKIDTSIKDKQGESASGYLETVIERNRDLINNPEKRDSWISDDYPQAIVDDAASMRQAISQIKLKGALGQTQERSGTIDESRSAEVIDMDDFRRRRAQGNGGPER